MCATDAIKRNRTPVVQVQFVVLTIISCDHVQVAVPINIIN